MGWPATDFMKDFKWAVHDKIATEELAAVSDHSELQ
jgi:hypothetical protein